MSVQNENISSILSVDFENNGNYYLLQVVPLHWSRSLTSQETIWAKRKKIYQNNSDNIKTYTIYYRYYNDMLFFHSKNI
jgi:hypothetical protein